MHLAWRPLALAQVWLLVLPLLLVAQEPDDWQARYAERAAALAADDARGHYALARWCQQCNRPEEARRHYGIVLGLDPSHARARQAIEALGGAPAEQGEASQGGIPRTPGRHDLTLDGFTGDNGAPARYALLVPDGVPAGRTLPLVIIHSFLAKSTQDPGGVLADWNGFAGYVAVTVDYGSDYTGYQVALAERLLENCPIDRESILISDWRSGHEVPIGIGRRPDLFRYGYSDSTWGGSPFPAVPTATPEQRAILRDAHVYMKLTGEGYKPQDRGYDDADAREVAAYWEALGVRDVVIERYPRCANPSETPDYSCIKSGGPGPLVRQWFERKLREAGAVRELQADCARREAAVPEGDVRALTRFAAWCEEQGLTDKAIEAYRKILEIEPERTQIRRALDRLTGGS